MRLHGGISPTHRAIDVRRLTVTGQKSIPRRLLWHPEDVLEDLVESGTDGSVSFDEAREIRLQLIQVAASNALQYAALAVGVAVLWGALLSYAGPVGDSSPLWLVEGILAAGVVHAILNSAFYGRYGGLIGAMIPLAELESINDPELPYPRDPRDHLSRLNYRYHLETKKKWYIAPFGNVFSMKLVYFVIVGAVGGLVLATPNDVLRLIVVVPTLVSAFYLTYRARKSNLQRFANLSSTEPK